jgi:Zn-dependent protease with chaperone function
MDRSTARGQNGILAEIKAAIAIAVFVAVGLYVWRCESAHRRHAEFVADVAAKGEAQNKRAAAEAAARHGITEKNDAHWSTEVAARDARIADLASRLRTDPGGSVLPAPSGATVAGARITFDRAELDAALRSFTAGAAELVGEGEKGIAGINLVRSWRIEQLGVKSGD